MKSKTNSSPLNFNRLMVMIVSIFILIGVWMFISRISGAFYQKSIPLFGPREGFAAPDFTLDTLEGGQLTLSQMKGHPVILNLWATWCYPCRQEMPAIEKVYQRYKEAGLVVIGLNLTLQDSEAAVKAFVEELGLTFPIVLDRDGPVIARYQLIGLPSTFFIDQSGIIQSAVVGGPMSEASIQSKVEGLLQK